MIGLLQRVARATVAVDGTEIARIGRGALVFVGVQPDDTPRNAERLLERVLGYRVFPDGDKKMNLSLRDIAGDLLLVPQFTLAADTRKGTRASFTSAAPPALGHELFEYLVRHAAEAHANTACGRFGADMHVALVNDGPVTFWLTA